MTTTMKTMNEHDLDRECQRNKHCDGCCIKCRLFAAYMDAQDDAR